MTEKRSPNPKHPHRTPSVRNNVGKRVRLSDLPLVAYSLYCGHVGREHGVARNDLMFCPTCKDTKRVARIISS
jgi:hypothetical protein